ncbi:MAG: DUF4290 domain-containing protein [Bacteroidales bacterium]|nr:DUF4290 domain-containing protein [Bacteroidales bacterium]
MEYNTTRDQLTIREYGRNVQKMVEYAKTIEDKEKRTEFAKVIIQIMGQMNPTVRESGDFRHKLWDHLHIIANYDLDVNSPYDKPSPDLLVRKPDQLEYSENHIQFKMYGSNIAKIIQKAIDFEEGPEKDALVHTIANHLKKSYLNWNRESVADDLIFQHLEALSKGKLKLRDELSLNTTNDILSQNKKKKVTKPIKKGGTFKRKKK